MKKIIVLITALTLILTPLTLHASGVQADLTGGARAKAGRTLEMVFSFTPGETASGLQGVLSFDAELLTLQSVVCLREGWVAETGNAGTFIVYDDTLENPVRDAAELLRLTFLVSDTAPADALLTVSVHAEDEFSQTAEASFTAIAYTASLRGDVDADGDVDERDRMLLSRFLADWDLFGQTLDTDAMDVDNDGEITARDRAILARYLAGWGAQYETYFD